MPWPKAAIEGHANYLMGDTTGDVNVVCECGWSWYAYLETPANGVTSVDDLIVAWQTHLDGA